MGVAWPAPQGALLRARTPKQQPHCILYRVHDARGVLFQIESCLIELSCVKITRLQPATSATVERFLFIPYYTTEKVYNLLSFFHIQRSSANTLRLLLFCVTTTRSEQCLIEFLRENKRATRQRLTTLFIPPIFINSHKPKPLIHFTVRFFYPTQSPPVFPLMDFKIVGV